MVRFLGILAFLIVCVVWEAHARGPYFFVVAPNLIRFGHYEELTISILGRSEAKITYHLEFQTGPDGHSTAPNTVDVTENQPVIATVKIGPEDIANRGSERKPDKVTLVAHSDFSPEERRTDILLSYNSGYIFIQTDKPIYYPRDTIKIRTLTLTEGLRELDNQSLIVDVRDPDGHVMHRSKVTHKRGESAFHMFEFKMLKNPPTGMWKIHANLSGEYETLKISSFQVEEYKLPTFGVDVSVGQGYILEDQEEDVVIFVKSMYVYGKPVQGKVEIKLYLEAENEMDEDVFLMKCPRPLINGRARCDVTMGELRGKLEMEGFWFPEARHLLINATVTEDATSNKEMGMHRSTVFSMDAYKFDFSRSKKYFQSSMVYYLKVSVTYVNGSAAARVPITVQCTGCSSQEMDGMTNEKGYDTLTFNTQGDHIGNLRFKVITTVSQSESEWFEVEPYHSDNDNRLRIDMDTDHGDPQIQIRTNIKEAGSYTGMVAMFTSRGKPVDVLYRNTEIEMSIEFDAERRDKLEKANPSARCTVFYVDETNDEVVADSFKLPLENRCRGPGGWVWANRDIFKGGLTLSQIQTILKVDKVLLTDEIKLQIEVADSRRNMEPGDTGRFRVNGSPNMRVGLKAMDKALLLRNNKNILTPTYLYRELERHDLGCGQGGGSNSASVFENVGLAVVTNANLNTPQRQGAGCPQSNRRKKRDTRCSFHMNCCEYGDKMGDDIIIDFEDENHQNEELGDLILQCKRKGKALLDIFYRPCVKAIYERCLEVVKGYIRSRSSSRFLDDEDLEYMEDLKAGGVEGKIKPRTNFKESWLFEEILLRSDGTSAERRRPFPDSITDWMFSAVGISPEHGVCVADPVNVTVFKDLFIQLDMPYSAVRLDTIDIKATVFNYDNSNVNKTVKVYMEGVDHICSGTGTGENTAPKRLVLPPNSAQTVRFPIIPLKAGSSGEENKFDIKVKAIRVDEAAGETDAITKKLYVKENTVTDISSKLRCQNGREYSRMEQPWVSDNGLSPVQFQTSHGVDQHNEGILERKKIDVCLDPLKQGNDCIHTPGKVTDIYRRSRDELTQSITVNMTVPEEALDGTAYAHARLTGNNVMADPVDTILTNIESLIEKPSGCGEQTMVRLAPAVYAMNFLKQTDQVTPDIETKGSTIIRGGVMHELQYQKKNGDDHGSFAVWSTYPSSTWLTAFVLKVYCQAEKIVSGSVVMNDHVTPGINWLARKQLDDGSFQESYTVHHRVMTGLLTFHDPSLAAFVLITMMECSSRPQDLGETATRALNYLESRDIDTLTDYQLAIITYALALAKSDRRHEFNEKLVDRKYPRNDDGRQEMKPVFWGTPNDETDASAGAIETTGYALLAQLEFDDLHLSGKIVRWLVLNRYSGGSYKTTQATVVGLHALAEYNIKSYSSNVDLRLKIGKHQDQTRLTSENAMYPMKIADMLDMVNDNGELNILVSGTGLGRMVIEMVYNREPEENEICRFDITPIEPKQIDPADIIFAGEKVCDACGICDDDNDNENLRPYPSGEELQGRVEPRSDRAGRRRRNANEDTNEEIQYCVRFNVTSKGPDDAGMSIVDFGLQTGLTVHEPDLIKLVEQNIISSYDMPSSGNGFVILYLDEIKVSQPKQISFKLNGIKEADDHQQASVVSVYDYYDPDRKCNTFYSAGFEKGPPVGFDCDNNARCKCMQGLCAQDYLPKLKHWRGPGRLVRTACTKADYAIIVTIKELRNGDQPNRREAVATVDRKLKTGAEELVLKKNITLHWKTVCPWPDFKINEKYVIVAKDGPRKQIDENNFEYTYPLMDQSIVFKRKKAGTVEGQKITSFVKMMGRKRACDF